MTTPDPDRALVARASADVTYGAMRTIDRDNGGGGGGDASPRTAARVTRVIITILFMSVYYNRRFIYTQRTHTTHTTHTTRAKHTRRQHRRALKRHSIARDALCGAHTSKSTQKSSTQKSIVIITYERNHRRTHRPSVDVDATWRRDGKR
jgi:hypothetical protein